MIKILNAYDIPYTIVHAIEDTYQLKALKQKFLHQMVTQMNLTS